MKTLAPFLLVFFALTSGLLADVTLAPAAPKAGEAFDIRVEGVWRDSCVPADPRLFIADKKLVATLTLSGGGACLSAVTAFSTAIHVPGLAAGSYQLSARVLDYDGPRKFFDKTIQISGAPSGITSILSAFDTSAGNRVVKIRGSFPCAATGCTAPTVLFGSKPAEAVERISDAEIHAVAPAQTHVSVVDVTVLGDGYTYVLPSGFTYVNLSDYERFLVPVSTRNPVPGALGSLWQSEFRLVNQSGITLEPGIDVFHLETREMTNPPLTPNQVVVPALAMPRLDSDVPPTTLLYVRKELAPFLSPQLRIRDLSRQSETWGTEIPVVRESNLRWNFTLLDIPMKDGFRQTLRLYITDYVGCCATRVTFLSPTGEELFKRDVFLQHANGSIGGLVPAPYLREGSREFPLQPAYAQIDLGSIPELAGHDSIWIRAQSYGAIHLWGFVSVTNDATQHVTMITPQ
ncbi:MAG TPA: hypothetical protein VKL19_16235 [Thermoanaerobaculia bacterium]|nr:hypothetical protein [Thermoanaerobaculia bacterium]